MKWVTRERPKIDRIACPWLIARFIDTAPEFLYVPGGEVKLNGNGGTLEVDSGPGRGTRMTLRLPAAGPPVEADGPPRHYAVVFAAPDRDARTRLAQTGVAIDAIGPGTVTSVVDAAGLARLQQVAAGFQERLRAHAGPRARLEIVADGPRRITLRLTLLDEEEPAHEGSQGA